MNDSTEQLLASQYAVDILSALRFPKRSFGEGMVEYALELLERGRRLPFEISRTYTVSLSSESDSLEQWRAYCPRSGGVALGFSAAHLKAVAADQGFILASCVYDEPEQEAIVRQIIEHHLDIWNKRKTLTELRQGISSHLVRDLISDLERFAALLKHRSFAAEREWRLISPLLERQSAFELIHVPSPSGIKQFRLFSLLTTEHPSVVNTTYDDENMGAIVVERQGFRPVIGPNVDPDGMDEAIRALTPPEFGWVYAIEHTASPYR
ncbi:DUF2971 domain-containing protein [Humibacter sp. RRB41]|uniref:DUF2971 domain-containing protein n=1 Tax=Humibacter sp. RRB41 TaxID=2919946 RepID=UPI001FA9D24D|nr:DUF2971 domain-containing protein [Humibacter sp. RRB41]